MPKSKKFNLKSSSYLTGLATGLLSGLLLFILLPALMAKSGISVPTGTGNPTPSAKSVDQKIQKNVLPEKYKMGVSFGSAIKKLVDAGAIDKTKFLDLYESRGGLPDEFVNLLDADSDEKITVTAENSGVILNLLWPLGIANKTETLSQGPMGTQYKDEVGNFASTGGWTLGKEDGGKLFNRFPIIELTDEQEKLVTEIAQNIYRPCCGNSTYFPDCNHGAAMLGFIELAVAQGLSKDEIYKEALVLNAYWFPATYVELAVYFKSEKGKDWNKINPKELLGSNYSSGQGYAAVNKELQAKGLLPKVEGGGGCGV